jgi:hypothetical protein
MGHSKNRLTKPVPCSPTRNSHGRLLRHGPPRSRGIPSPPSPDDSVEQFSLPPRPSILNSPDWPSHGLPSGRSTVTLNELHHDKSSCHIQSLIDNPSNEDPPKLTISISSLPVLPFAGRLSTIIGEPDDPNNSPVSVESSAPQLGEVPAPSRSSSSNVAGSRSVQSVPSVAEESVL